MYEGTQYAAEQKRAEYLAKMQEKSIGACAKAPEKSPIEMAVDRLESMVDDAGRHSEQLYVRLQSVSHSAPVSTSGGACDGRPDSCSLEARLNELSAHIGRIAVGLRDMRDNLCI